MFLKNCWYVAAWSTEITAKPMARKILGKSLVLYRTASGRAAALENRCCHRGAPLTLGEVDGEVIRCGYHGLEYAIDGACVKIPGQDLIPPLCSIKSYPIVEQDSVLWIWMGEASKADPSKIIPYPWHRPNSGWAWKGTTYVINCHYELIHDNLLDLTHLGYVHRRTIGGDPNAHVNADMKTTRVDRHVKVIRWMRDSVPPPTYVNAVGFNGHIDRWQEIEFWPGLLRIWTGGMDVNTGAYDGERKGGFQLRIFDGITPETEETSFYFWSSAHNFKIDQPAVTEKIYNEIALTFDEDRVVLEEQQKELKLDPLKGLVDINADVGGIQARRIMQRLIAEEQVVLVGETERKATAPTAVAAE